MSEVRARFRVVPVPLRLPRSTSFVVIALLASLVVSALRMAVNVVVVLQRDQPSVLVGIVPVAILLIGVGVLTVRSVFNGWRSAPYLIGVLALLEAVANLINPDPAGIAVAALLLVAAGLIWAPSSRRYLFEARSARKRASRENA